MSDPTIVKAPTIEVGRGHRRGLLWCGNCGKLSVLLRETDSFSQRAVFGSLFKIRSFRCEECGIYYRSYEVCAGEPPKGSTRPDSGVRGGERTEALVSIEGVAEGILIRT